MHAKASLVSLTCMVPTLTSHDLQQVEVFHSRNQALLKTHSLEKPLRHQSLLFWTHTSDMPCAQPGAESWTSNPRLTRAIWRDGSQSCLALHAGAATKRGWCFQAPGEESLCLLAWCLGHALGLVDYSVALFPHAFSAACGCWPLSQSPFQCHA